MDIIIINTVTDILNLIALNMLSLILICKAHTNYNKQLTNCCCSIIFCYACLLFYASYYFLLYNFFIFFLYFLFMFFVILSQVRNVVLFIVLFIYLF